MKRCSIQCKQIWKAKSDEKFCLSTWKSSNFKKLKMSRNEFIYCFPFSKWIEQLSQNKYFCNILRKESCTKNIAQGKSILLSIIYFYTSEIRKNTLCRSNNY